MNNDFKSVETADVAGKRVLVRCDFDVPFEGGKITDETRLISSISTIEYILENGGSVIAAGHRGRPDTQSRTQNVELRIDEFSLEPVAKWYAEEFPGTRIEKISLDGFPGWMIKENFYILENLRLSEGEEANDPHFSKSLADLADIYVNEAFGSSHRKHASIVGLPLLLPHYAGFHFHKEVKVLSSILSNTKRPLAFIVGGAKIETKLPLITKMHKFADYVLVGGELAENDKELARVAHENTPDRKSVLLVADLTTDGKDITEYSIQNFLQVIKNSSTIVWNGPMGEIEKCFDLGTREIAEAIASSSAYKVVGGGDTNGFLAKEGLLESFSFVSTGGGAMLEYLTGEELPGIRVLLQ